MAASAQVALVITSSVSVHPKLMAAIAQVASLVITVLKYKYLEVLQYYALHVHD